MARFSGSFAGGMAGGLRSGYALGLEAEEAKERKKDREATRARAKIDLESAQLGLETQKQSAATATQIRKLFEERLMEPTLSEDAAGNVTQSGSRMRHGLKDEDYFRVGMEAAKIKMAAGQMDPADYMKRVREFEESQRSGNFKALLDSAATKDPAAYLKHVDPDGKKYKAGTFTTEKNEYGIEEPTLVLRKSDDSYERIRPSDVGAAAGTYKDYMERREKAEERALRERQVGAQERSAGAQELSAEASMVRARNPYGSTGGSGGGGVYAAKREDWKKVFRSQFPNASEDQIEVMAVREANRTRGDINPVDRFKAATQMFIADQKSTMPRYKNVIDALDDLERIELEQRHRNRREAPKPKGDKNEGASGEVAPSSGGVAPNGKNYSGLW